LFNFSIDIKRVGSILGFNIYLNLDAEVTDDDDVNDPEYNVMDEQEEYDAEEIRNDKATRISSKYSMA